MQCRVFTAPKSFVVAGPIVEISESATHFRMVLRIAIERDDQWLERRYLNAEELALIPHLNSRLTKTA